MVFDGKFEMKVGTPEIEVRIYEIGVGNPNLNGSCISDVRK